MVGEGRKGDGARAKGVEGRRNGRKCIGFFWANHVGLVSIFTVFYMYRCFTQQGS